MVTDEEFFAFVSDVLGVPASALSLETTYAAIPEWDSMAQLRLVTEMESRWGVAIPFADVPRVTSLWELYRRVNGLSPKKAVALDLDGTLWDGVVGEDGVAALRPKRDFLAELKALKNRGVLLTILSKNNEPDVRAALDAGLLAPLAADDFVAMKVDWKPKAENLQEIARELNLGLDAFVFVDDNPAERIEMAARCPEAAVATFPPVLSAYFPEGEVTNEDRRKTEEYREEAARRKFLASASEAPVDVWSALGAWCDVRLMRDDEAARVAQLSQRANQFSVCTNRYTADEVAALAHEPQTFVYVVHAGDRFGDQGLVLFVVVKDGAIADWTMSCRVAGRGLEERAWAEIERDLRTKGVSSLRATWKASGRNAPVADLFSRLGFMKENEGTSSLQVYSKLIQYAPKP